MELFDASRRLAELVTIETGITPLLARLFAQQLVDLQKNGKSVSGLPRSVPDLMLSYLNALNRDRAATEPDDIQIHRAAKIAAWVCLMETFKPGQAGSKEIIRKALAGGGLSDTLLEVLENRLKLVKTLLPARLEIQFLLDPLTEYLAALQVVEEWTAADEKEWRHFLADADSKPRAPGAIRGFLAAVRDCCLARPRLNVPASAVDDLARRIGLDPDLVNTARRNQRILRLISNLDLSEPSDRVYAAQQLGELGPAAEAAIPALVKSVEEDPEPEVRVAAAKALGIIGNVSFPSLNKLPPKDPDIAALERLASVAVSTVPLLIIDD